MATVTGIVKRSPDACWRVLVDPSNFSAWIPTLKRANVVDTYDDTGLPREIRFELASERTFSRVYSYDHGKQITWTPRGDGASGYARLDAVDGGTRITYTLQGNSEYDLDMLIARFQSWMHAY
jgi:hypothetical protein